MTRLVTRDEREIGVDHAADRLSYLVLSFGVLAVVAWRSFVFQEASWELLGLVVVAGAAGAAYRIRERVASRSWLLISLATGVLALVVAAILALTTRG